MAINLKACTATKTLETPDRFFIGQKFYVVIEGGTRAIEVFGINPAGGYLLVDESGELFQGKISITLEVEKALNPISVYERQKTADATSVKNMYGYYKPKS